MKKTLWLVPMTLALATAGCSDILTEDPSSVLTNETFYRNQADMELARVALYAALRNGYGFGWAAYPSLASDEAHHHKGEPTALIVEPDYLDYTPGSGNVPGIWAAWWPLVFRANLILQNAPDADLPDGYRSLVMAEASFFRAYAYLSLVKSFGDVPLLLTVEDQAADDITRVDAATVLDQVLSDLEVAEAGLPLTQTADQNGMLRKGAAQMALAETYLWRSSAMGTGEWQAAADAAMRVINSGVYQLNADYLATFRPSNKNNPELIFVETAAGQNGPGTPVGLLYGIRELPFFFPGGGFQILVPTDWLLDLYPAGDYRREGSYANHPITGPFPPSEEVAVQKFPWADPAYSTEAEFPIYRYGETLLMYAEAENELGDQATAIQYVNMVRARARQGTGGESRAEPADLAPMSQAATRAAIYDERAMELSFEAKRWFDMIRRDGIEPGYWGQALEAHDPNATGRHPIQEFRMLFPIPSSEVIALPSLTQNPGY